jgi:uncharacterized protein
VLREKEERVWVLAYQTGDSIVSDLEGFARDHRLRGAHFTGIGAFQDVVLRYFDWESKEYQDIPVNEQVEVLSFIGNIAASEGAPKVHAHLVLGRRDGTTLGGHFKDGHVRPTLELVLVEEPGDMIRALDQVTGLPLLDLEG